MGAFALLEEPVEQPEAEVSAEPEEDSWGEDSWDNDDWEDDWD